KLFSRLLTALTLIGLSLPVLALVRLLGGVEVQQMIGVICLCAVVALTSAALGLMLSVIVSRAYAVILLAYLLMGIAYAFVPMIVMVYASAAGARGAMRYIHFFTTYNPFMCTGFLASGQMRVMADQWGTCVLTHLVVTAVFLFLSALLVRRLARREGDANAAYTPAVPMPAPAPATSVDDVPSVAPLAVPVPPAGATLEYAGAEGAMARATAKRGRANRAVSDNPVLWRELRRPLTVTLTQRVVGTVIILGLLVTTYSAAYANDALNDEDTQIGFSVVFHGLMMLVACVIAATAIAQEKEGDTWTILLASPLSSFAIVWGKAIGAARKMLWPMVLIVVHFAVFMIAGVIPLWGFVLVVSVIVLYNTVWIATGIYLSLRCRKVTLAIIINLGLPVLLYGVFSLVLGVIDELMHLRGDLIEQVTWYLPFYYLGEGMNRADDLTVDLPGPGHSKVSGEAFTAIAIVVGLLHLGVAVAILSWTVARFNEIVGRAPQHYPLADRIPRRNPTQPGAKLGLPTS
ncbi:MAG: hypothetical protein QOF78_4323, partial [Phycisphaerales bacterium]|nr:hypothetical protein [Phycisphaerales bacterium]